MPIKIKFKFQTKIQKNQQYSTPTSTNSPSKSPKPSTPNSHISNSPKSDDGYNTPSNETPAPIPAPSADALRVHDGVTLRSGNQLKIYPPGTTARLQAQAAAAAQPTTTSTRRNVVGGGAKGKTSVRRWVKRQSLRNSIGDRNGQGL